MNKRKLEIFVFLLGVLSCLILLQTEVEASKSDEGIVIALRAPTSKVPGLVKCPGTKDEKSLKKGILSLSLPENTPISFCVDQVNTALYTVEIKVTEEKPKASTLLESPDISKLITGIIEAMGSFSPEVKSKLLMERYQAAKVEKQVISSLNGNNATGENVEVSDLEADVESLLEADIEGLKGALEDLKKKVKAVGELNGELDKLLYASEHSEFYNRHPVNVNASFANIQTEAENLTRTHLGLESGTSQAVYNAAVTSIGNVHAKYKALGIAIPICLPKDLSDTSNEITAAFRYIVEKLRRIETATWTKVDTETRFLKKQIKYTCVFTPKEKNANLQQLTRVVVVTGCPNGWIIKTTQGPLISGLTVKSCLISSTSGEESGEDEVFKEKFRFSAGPLMHVYHSKFKYLGPTVGLGLDGDKNPQVALGLSGFWHINQESLFALTVGGILGKVDGRDAQGGETPTTEMVNDISWFGAITFNFDSFFDIDGTN